MYNAFLSNVSLYYASLFYVVEVHLWIWHPNTNNNEYRWIWQTTTNNNQWWILAKWKNCLLAGGISTLQHRKLLCRRAALASNTEIITTGDISTRQHKKHMCRRVLYTAYQLEGKHLPAQSYFYWLKIAWGCFTGQQRPVLATSRNRFWDSELQLIERWSMSSRIVPLPFEKRC
jgi:hypothetical protein